MMACHGSDIACSPHKKAGVGMANETSRPPTPDPVKRQLRQRGGYGCCRCGFAIYQYHHIIPYSAEPHFRVEDMMILCPNCHSMATDGALTIDEQRAIQQEPYNLRRGYASGAMKVNQPYCAVAAGGVLLVGNGPLITADEFPLLTLEAGHGGEMLLSINLMDEHDHALALIEQNEWVSGDASIWDMESGHQKLTIRQAYRRISLDINAKNEPVRLRAELWRKGRLIGLNQTGVTVDAHRLERPGGIGDLGLVDISLNLDLISGNLRLIPYVETGCLVSEADPLQRLSKSVNEYRRRHP
jgi:trigger factor